MIRKSDWPLIGLRVINSGGARFGVPAAAASLPLREDTELYPHWAANPPRRLQLGLGCSLHWGRARSLVAELRERFAGLDLSLTDVDEHEAGDALLREDLDAAILVQCEPPEGLRAASLWSERLIAAVPEGHRLAQGNAVDPADLRQEAILLPGPARAHAGLQRAITRALCGSPATFVREDVERDTLFDLVALNFGVTVAPGATTGAFYPGVVFRPIAGPGAEVGYTLVWKPDNRNPALHDFVRFARAFGREAERPTTRIGR